MPRHKKAKKVTKAAHGGLAKRHPALRNIDAMELVDVAEHSQAEPVHTVQLQSAPQAKNYSTPTPEQETTGFRQRRAVRLKPELPPLTPASQWYKN